MGTDIHAVFQAKKDDAWIDVDSQYKEERHYFLFAWLAGVRNGFGFAGVPTHTPIKPIAEPRGLPDDFQGHDSTKELMGRHAEYLEDGEDPHVWMGDHSHSWLTADEIIAVGAPGKTWRTGIVSRTFFDAWDGHTSPETWSGDISGTDIYVAEWPSTVKEGSTHVRIFWMQADEDVLSYFTDEIKRLKSLHGEVRMVFGFDS